MLAVFAAVIAFAAGYMIPPGRYLGTWSGQSSDGKIDIRIIGDDKTIKSTAVTFTYNGADVPTRTKAFTVSGGAFEVTYEFELSGNTLVSALKGSLEGKKLSGTYRTTTRDGGEGVDSGTWSAERQ